MKWGSENSFGYVQWALAVEGKGITETWGVSWEVGGIFAGLTLKGDHSTHQCRHGSHNVRWLGGLMGSSVQASPHERMWDHSKSFGKYWNLTEGQVECMPWSI